MTSASIVEFPRVGKWQCAGWTQEERQLLDKVERYMTRVGSCEEVVHGATDRGDPWVAYMGPGDGDYVLCFTKVGPDYACFMSGGAKCLSQANDLHSVVGAVFPILFVPLRQEVG